MAEQTQTSQQQTEQHGEPTARARRTSHAREKFSDRLIAGVPALIMRPRLVFLVALSAVLAFGLLMVYSASSVEALKETGSSTYYLIRQAAYMGIGLAIMVFIANSSLEKMRSHTMTMLWIGLLVMLLAVLVIGEDINGAKRWVTIGFQFQPSELGKPIIICMAAKMFYQFYDERSIDDTTFIIKLSASVLMPLALIITEPDLGSCIIIIGTIFIMCYLAGFSYRLVIPLVATGIVIVIALIVTSGYRSARLLSDPWADPYGDGYQATLAIMAFASGGLFGRGIGGSTMKYNYLPEAHNDYILAIIGEEVGFVGTIIFFIVYFTMIIAAFKIANRAKDTQGRLIAYGAATMIMLQFIVNALGILNVLPMTGKTMPFISYGGSSIIASLMLAGLILRVSIESGSKTVYDKRRERMAIVEDNDELVSETLDGSTAGLPHRRSERSGFSVVDGGTGGGTYSNTASVHDRPSRKKSASSSRVDARSRRTKNSYHSDESGYGRINLGNDPADRLRSRKSSGPRTRTRSDQVGRGRYD